MAWHFITKVSTLIQYFTAWNLIIFKNSEVTDVLASPLNNFLVMKKCSHKTCYYVQNT